MRLACCLAAIGWLLGTTSALAEFRAAIATRTVTPDPLLPVSGGIGAPHPVTEKKGELTVRALVLSDHDTRIAIVSVDFLGWPMILGDRARRGVTSVPPENILIAATHTHSAPDPYAFPNAEGKTGADLEYLRSVSDRIAESIEEAAARLQPVSVRIATGEARGKIAYNAYAENLFDPRCGVIQFLDPQDQPVATMVNYAVHPEVLGPRAGICSPDLVGPLYDRIREREAGIGIFINGAQGGMVTADNRGPDGRDISTWDECVRIGTLLADEALRIVANAPAQSDPKLECVSRTVRFPVESPIIKAVLNGSPMGYTLEPDGSVATRINLVQLGNARILTIPGEALPNIGAYLKRKMGTDHPFLFGLTNDAFGYILTKEDWGSFRRYDYITRTCLGERTGEILVNESLELLADTTR